jgi:hypothetical protein
MAIGLGLSYATYLAFLQDTYKMREQEARDHVKRRGLPPTLEQVKAALDKAKK